MAKKSAVQVEVDRINKYFKTQTKKYGNKLLVPNAINPEYILAKYKSPKTQLAKLRDLTTLKLKGQLKIVDWEQGTSMSLREYHSKQKSQQAKKRLQAQSQNEIKEIEEVAQENETVMPVWDEETKSWKTEQPLPIKEEIELNNLGEEISSVTGESWNYQEYALANYKEVMKLTDNELKHSKFERLNIAIMVNEWLQNLIDQFGLATVAKMLNEGIGSNSITRNDIFYDGQRALDFIYRMMDHLPIDSELKDDILQNVLSSVNMEDIGIYN